MALMARSFRELARDPQRVTKLLLSKSQDVVCSNMMCEQLGSPCLCRLSIVLEKAGNLQHLDLSCNELPDVPQPLFKLHKLQRLDLSQNNLKTLAPEVGQLTALQTLDLRHNQLSRLPEQALGKLVQLQTILVFGNLITKESVQDATLLFKLDFETSSKDADVVRPS